MCSSVFRPMQDKKPWLFITVRAEIVCLWSWLNLRDYQHPFGFVRGLQPVCGGTSVPVVLCVTMIGITTAGIPTKIPTVPHGPR